ncbi:MAG: MerR family transcriptional regulator [Pseudomonadota bacterium]
MDKSPDAFRTISEVAEWLDVPTHVLRFWESRFSQVKPVKRAGGRRYYRPSDMQLIGGIKRLLHDDGMTIRGVQKLLREEGVKHVAAFSQPLEHEMATVVELKAEHVEPTMESGPLPASDMPDPPRVAVQQNRPLDTHTGAEAPEDEPKNPEPKPQPSVEPVLAFGSVRSSGEPELPFDAAEESEATARTDEVPEPPAEAPASYTPAADAPATEAAVPDPEPAPDTHTIQDTNVPEPVSTARIPATPDVPETDVEDDAPTHAGPAGYTARLIVRDRRAEQPDATQLTAIVDALRRVRDRDAL